MKIVHIISPGFRGAGKLAFDIHKELLKRNHDSFLICKEETKNIPFAFSYKSSFYEILLRTKNKIMRYLNAINRNRIDYPVENSFIDLKENRNQFRYRSIVDKMPFKPEVVILYALQGFLNFKTINKIYRKTNAKIFWLLYDAAPLTGGCHYPWNCNKYEEKCGKCPQLRSDDENDITRRNWYFKENQISRVKFEIISGSSWIREKAKASSLFKNFPIHDWIVPVEKAAIEKNMKDLKLELGLLETTKYILFGSTSTTNERKGIRYLFEALNILKEKRLIQDEIVLLVIGKEDGLNVSKLPYKAVCTGYIQERETLVKYYKAAHIVIVPSLEDAGPMMINEAINSGTPVVSFETGIAADLVFNGITGYRAKLRDSNDLAKGIAQIINLEEVEYEKIVQNCISLSIEQLSFEKQINKLVEIFRNKG